MERVLLDHTSAQRVCVWLWCEPWIGGKTRWYPKKVPIANKACDTKLHFWLSSRLARKFVNPSHLDSPQKQSKCWIVLQRSKKTLSVYWPLSSFLRAQNAGADTRNYEVVLKPYRCDLILKHMPFCVVICFLIQPIGLGMVGCCDCPLYDKQFIERHVELQKTNETHY